MPAASLHPINATKGANERCPSGTHSKTKTALKYSAGRDGKFVEVSKGLKGLGKWIKDGGLPCLKGLNEMSQSD